MSIPKEIIQSAVAEAMPFARRLFDELREQTRDGAGVSREWYGKGEQIGHDIVRHAAVQLDLETEVDFAGNLYLTLPGADRARPCWITGSHMDSVPCGGNYDGAAGVIAGMTAISAMRARRIVPPRDITVMAVRAEEASSWYAGSHGGHIGSRAALGTLAPAELESATSIPGGLSLRECIRNAGFDPAAIAAGRQHLSAERFHAYIELHIEQGPVLEMRGIPVGIVTGIRGSVRARSVRCLGEYTHSGAVPREYRKDAVLATAELCHRLDDAWVRILSEGGDLVFTVGQFSTNPKFHSLSKVPGETAFTIDFRSQDPAILDMVTELTRRLAGEVGQRRHVQFKLGDLNLSQPAQMDETLQRRLLEGAATLSIPNMSLPSGAGHDAQDFAHAGFPAAMIFVRNAKGSHNPEEQMDMDDFRLGTTLLTWMLAQ